MKTPQELDAIRKAFGKNPLPEHKGVKIGGGEFVLTPSQRKTYERKKREAQARANAITNKSVD
jgi:hypothetical protein